MSGGLIGIGIVSHFQKNRGENPLESMAREGCQASSSMTSRTPQGYRFEGENALLDAERLNLTAVFTEDLRPRPTFSSPEGKPAGSV